MAERSFAREVQDLKLGAGEEFRGEGILAITKALLQSGVSYVGGYQGAPISHLMDVLADAKDVLDELGVHFENSASEAAAAATLAASVHVSDPRRGHLQVDGRHQCRLRRLANLASGGVNGGALIIIGEDYGEGSSIMQERSHAFAMKSQIWLLDPRPEPADDRQGGRGRLRAVGSLAHAGDARGAHPRLPRPRPLHRQGQQAAALHAAPGAGKSAARHRPHRAAARLLSAREGEDRAALAGGGQIHQGAQAQRVLRSRSTPTSASSCRAACTIGACARCSSSASPTSMARRAVPLYVLNVTYPLIDDEVAAFAADKKAVLMVEEGQPEFIEQAINTILRRRDIQTRIFGKDVLPMAGEYTPQVVAKGVKSFLDAAWPRSARQRAAAAERRRRPRRSEDQGARRRRCRRGRRASAPAVRNGRSSPR